MILRCRLTAAFCVVFAFLLVVGCGGGGGRSTPTPTVSRARFDIAWAARSRVINALSSPLSAIATLRQASPTGSDVTFTINRETAPATYTQNVTSPSDIRVGTWTFSLKFYTQTNGAGDIVGTAETPVTIASDGSGIGTVAVNWTIASIEVTAGQVIKAGQRKDLQFAARDASGALIAVTPGSAQVQVSTGTDKLKITEGQAEGLLPGSASIAVTVDNATSPVTVVRVGSDTAIALNPANPTLSIQATQAFTPTVTNAPSAGVTWTVQEGDAGGTISTAGIYTAPVTPGTYHIQAVSQYDPFVSVSVPVQVKAGKVDVTVQ